MSIRLGTLDWACPADQHECWVAPPVVAVRLRVSRKSAYAPRAAARGGREALRSKGPGGVPSRMKPLWREWLARALQGPAAHQVLAPEHGAVPGYRAIVDAIAHGNPREARHQAAALLALGTTAMNTFLSRPTGHCDFESGTP